MRAPININNSTTKLATDKFGNINEFTRQFDIEQTIIITGIKNIRKIVNLLGKFTITPSFGNIIP